MDSFMHRKVCRPLGETCRICDGRWDDSSHALTLVKSAVAEGMFNVKLSCVLLCFKLSKKWNSLCWRCSNTRGISTCTCRIRHRHCSICFTESTTFRWERKKLASVDGKPYNIFPVGVVRAGPALAVPTGIHMVIATARVDSLLERNRPLI